MDVAPAFPGDDFHATWGCAGPRRGPGSGRHHQHALGRQRIDHPHGIGGGAADVAFRLHRRGGIDVGHHRYAGQFRFSGSKLVRLDGFGQAAAHVRPGQQHGLVGAENGGGLRHEVDPAEDDDGGVGLGRRHGQLQGVAHQVGHILDGAGLVVVRQHNGPAALQPLLSLLFVAHQFPRLFLSIYLLWSRMVFTAHCSLLTAYCSLLTATAHGLLPSRTTCTPGGGLKVKKSLPSFTSSFIWEKVKRVSSPRALANSSRSTR